MKTWKRIEFDAPCGLCGIRMPKGAIMLSIHVEGMRRRLLRCPACAGEDAPPDLPPLIERSIPIAPMRHFKQVLTDVAEQARTARILGERE